MAREKRNIARLKEEYRTHYTRVYSQLAKQLFIWEGLPEGIPEDYLEDKLYKNGSLMFTEDANIGFYLTPYARSGQLDMYERPTAYNVVSLSDMNGRVVKADDAVIIKNNSEFTPTAMLIKKNIDELVELNITKLSNMTWQRIPIIFQGNQKNIQSLISIVEGTLEGSTAVSITDNALDMNQVEIKETKTQYLGAELRDEYRMITGELLTMLGINNLEISKKERLVSAEAEINKEEVSINLLAFLEPRLKAAEMINEKFGLNVSVSVNPLLVKEEAFEYSMEGETEYENDND